MPSGTSLADYLFSQLSFDREALIRQTGQVHERTARLYRRVLGRLGQMAEEEELSLGMVPLPAQPTAKT